MQPRACWGSLFAALWASYLPTLPCVGGERALVRLHGSDFKGGAAAQFGGMQFDTPDVNFVYARSTGVLSAMRAGFDLSRPPQKPQFLFLRARDDERAERCPIEIAINGRKILDGPSGFPDDSWTWKRFSVGDGVLKAGHNELAITNTAAKGDAGMPPWFMVADCSIGSEAFDPKSAPPIEDDFFVTLPDQSREMPEPLPAGQSTPGFAIRGTKGWAWTPRQYLAEIPWLARFKMNFLMNCYLSMFDIEHQKWDSGQANRWWEPLPDSKKRAYAEVVAACRKQGIQFCFCMNPNLASQRPLDYASGKDIDALWQHYAWMQGLGVKWFSISLDDISKGIDARGQAGLVNAILKRLRAQDTQVSMIFCPTVYTGTGENAGDAAYLDVLAQQLDTDVYVFWTGPQVVSAVIKRGEAEAYKKRVGHRLFLWDNYPVNDSAPTLHLGPLVGRDPDLGDVIDGYMSNPHYSQNEINRLPLLTLADYAYNPAAYDPERSIGQAILHLADTPEQRAVLRDLVELYPGSLICRQGTGFNPVLVRFDQIARKPHSRILAEAFIEHAENVAERLAKTFPDRFKDARPVLAGDIARMKAICKQRYAR